MKLLEQAIEDKLLQDIIDLVSPIEEETLKQRTDSLLSHLRITLSIEFKKQEFKNHIHKIKLEYYKRNLAILELILEKQNISENLRLLLKIIRENLGLKNISSYIDFYNLYYTYKKKELYTLEAKEFVLHESPKYYIESYLSALDLDIEENII